MRRCRLDLPNRCYHLISRVAHRALEFGGLQAANRKGRYDKEKLLWQFTVAIKSDPVGSEEGRHYMCEAMERIEARGKREGKRETMIETAKRLLANGKLMLKEVAECSGLSLAQVKKLQASMA